MNPQKPHPRPRPVPVALAAGLPFALAGSAPAAPPDGRLFVGDLAWLERYDPTLISSRFSADFGYESYEDDSDLYKLENTVRWGIPLHDGHALGFQVLLPMKWRETTTDDAFGLGDLELRGGGVGRLSPSLRYGLGANAVLDSASDPLLGDNAFILRPTAALRWDLNPVCTLGINIEYNFTPLDEGANDVSALEVKFPVAFKFNEDWSGFVSYNPRWDLLDESDRHRLELAVTRVWGADNEFAWSVGTELPLGSENFEFKLTTGFAWYF
jgi:hypothetical protein